MKKTITCCDRCGAKDIQGALSWKCGAPVRHDPLPELPDLEFDLCVKCCEKELRFLLQKMSYSEMRDWLAQVKRNEYPKSSEME